MKSLLFLILVLLSGCSTQDIGKLTKDEQREMSVISDGNFFLNGKLRGISGKSLTVLTLEELKEKASRYKSTKMTDYNEIIRKQYDLTLYTRKLNYTLCLESESFSFCDISDCVTDSIWSRESVVSLKPESLFCKK